MADFDYIPEGEVPEGTIVGKPGDNILIIPDGDWGGDSGSRPGDYNRRGMERDITRHIERFSGDESVIYKNGRMMGRAMGNPGDIVEEIHETYGTKGVGIGRLGPSPGTIGKTLGDGFDDYHGLEKKV